MKAFEIAKAIEELAPLSLQEDWDNSGFSVGDPTAEVRAVIIALDVTPKLIEEAKSLGANMIVSHHPMIFTGVKKLVSDSFTNKTIISAIKNDMIIYSCHTNMDKVRQGVTGVMAEKLGLQNVQILDKGLDDSGLGMIGELKRPLYFDEFLPIVKKSFSLKALRCSPPIDKTISKVALCGGSGHSLIDMAYKAGAEAYITADITYHYFFTYENFMIMDIGHFESEVGIVQKLYTILNEKFPTFATTF